MGPWNPAAGSSPLPHALPAARVVAADIAALIHHTAPPSSYEGDGNCYVEFGDGLVRKVEVNFLGGPSPTARIIAPSRTLAAAKQTFAATRRHSWFGVATPRAPITTTP